MKENIKKINIILIFILLLFTIISVDILNVKAEEKDYYEFLDCGYYVDKTIETKDLGYGITYRREKAMLATFDSSRITGNASGLGGGGAAEVGKFYQQQINMLEIANTEYAKIVPYAILEGSVWNTSTVRNAAKDYEEKHPEYKVVAAINGDFFKISNSCKASTGVTISDGEYYKAINNHGSSGGTLAIKNSGTGKQLFQTSNINSTPVLSIYDEEGNIIKKINIDVVNSEPSENQISLYYNTRFVNFDEEMEEVSVTNAFVVEKSIAGVTSVKNSFYGKGEISNILSTTLKNGQFAIKSNNSEISNLLKVGVTIRAQYEFSDESLNGVNNYVGFPFRILDNGTGLNGDNYRHPRTIIGQKEDGTIVMAVVDGRQPSSGMYGATGSEMAALMSYYGCVDAWNLDGGGSSTMLVRKQGDWVISSAYKDRNDSSWYVTNSPSDASERSDGNCILIVTKAPSATIEVANVLSDSITLNVCLLSMLDKYKDLYILLNGETHQVVNGQVTINNLNPHTEYIAYLYTEVNGSMFNLMTELSVNTSYVKPNDLVIIMSKAKKNGIDYYLLNCKVTNNESIKRYSVTLGDKTYNSSNGDLYISINLETLKSLHNFNFTILYDLDDGKKNQSLIIKPNEINCSASFVIDEQESFMNEIFNNILFE